MAESGFSVELGAAEIDQLTQQVDAQLQAVRTVQLRVSKGAEDELARKRLELEMQWQLVAQEVQEPTDNFLRKFGRVTRRDICEEGGLLNQQWKQYQDLSSSSTVQVVAGALAGLGIVNVPILVVPVAVIVVHLGLRTFCEEYGCGADEDAAERDA